MNIERVTLENWPQLVQLFEGSAECADCWCMNHRRAPGACPTGPAAKAALLEEISSGRAYGLLALVDGAPAGWCAVDPVATQIGHDYVLEGGSSDRVQNNGASTTDATFPDRSGIDALDAAIPFQKGITASSPWMIHCLYVDAKFRGQGVSKELIRAAIKLARENGATEVLAFPIPEDSAGKFPPNIAEFSGRLSTFQKAGFTQQQRLNDFYQVVSLEF